MSELILEITETSLEQDVLTATGPVLLDLWAPWCGPCRALAPVLKKLSSEYQGVLQIAKVDVEKYPDVQRRFGVRGIPTMILFRNGEEASRAIGSKSSEEMRRWLSREGVTASPEAPLQTNSDLDMPRSGAFHGDAELRDFLVARLGARALAGRVKASRMPFWIDGNGTISAALVGSADFSRFEGITGMPASFACALEFGLNTDPSPEGLDALMDAIPLGADLRDVAPRLMLALFDGSMGDWPAIINDEALDSLRVRWLALLGRNLTGREVKREEWNALAGALEALRSADHAPERQVQDAVIDVLTALSPLPYPDDGASWARGMLLLGKYLLYVLAENRLGWKTEDYGLERFRDAWFTERQKREPEGAFTPETLELARGEWMQDHGARQRRQDAFHGEFAQHMAPVNATVRACLTELLSRAPIISES